MNLLLENGAPVSLYWLYLGVLAPILYLTYKLAEDQLP
jgi:hypothetical protein